MENEENKNNEIVEVTAEDDLPVEFVPLEDVKPEDSFVCNEPKAEESAVEEPASEELSKEAEPAGEESSSVEETPVEEEPEGPPAEESIVETSEETALEEPVSEESVSEEPVSEEPISEETVSEEPADDKPEETASEKPVEEEPSVAEKSSVDEEPEGAPAEETIVEASDETASAETVSEQPPADENVVPEEPAADENAVSEEPAQEVASQEKAEGPEEAGNEAEVSEPTETETENADDDADLVFEEVILIDEEPKEKAPEQVESVVTEEAAAAEPEKDSEEQADVQPEEVKEETPEQCPEEPVKTEAVQEEKTAEVPETAEPSEPEIQKKNNGGIVLKVVGLIVILLLIFVPAGFSLWKGEPFRKELINYKNGLSHKYESYYRKEIFPKLSAAFVPEWAKQMKLEEEKRAAEEAKRREEEARKAEEDRKKDILYGVPQVPEGLEYFPLYIDDRMIVYGRDDWLYTAGDTSLACYTGTNVLSDEEMAAYANLLDTLGNICKAKGVELVMEVAPNKEQVYPEHYPSVTVENQKKRLLVMERYMRENCSVPFIYPIRELAAHKDQYDTYWKYDTHWNSTGAFIGMKEIYKALGQTVNDKDAIMRTEATNRGDLAGIAGYTDLYTDYIIEYKPAVTVGREVFNDSDYDIDEYGVRYISTANNERKLVVCGDSYRVSLAAHMCKDYKYTDVIHRDIINTDVAIARLRELSQGDTLVLICVERWDYRMFDAIYSLIAVMQES